MRCFPQITAAALLLATALPGSAWAGAGFNKTLQLQGTNFQVQSSGEGSQQQLTITTTGAKPPIKPIRQTVNGHVVGAEVADLNGNGLPEIYVFVQGAGSGSYGELVAYAVMKGSELSPITLPELTGANAQGYRVTTSLRWWRAAWRVAFRSTNQATATPRRAAASGKSATSSRPVKPVGSFNPPASSSSERIAPTP